MSIQKVFRVQCKGSCRGWLRKGRSTPAHWGDGYAELFPTEEAAEQAMTEAGWVDGFCAKDLKPIPEGAEVTYEGQQWRVVEHQDPQKHPRPPVPLEEIGTYYPDGVAYWLHPVDRPLKMDNGAFSKVFVRRTSIEQGA
jgi:hypothetical protein